MKTYGSHNSQEGERLQAETADMKEDGSMAQNEFSLHHGVPSVPMIIFPGTLSYLSGDVYKLHEKQHEAKCHCLSFV